MSWISALANKRFGSHFPRIQNLATQRQDAPAASRSRCQPGRATCRVTLDEIELVLGNAFALAIGQLAGQHRHTAALALLDLLRILQTRLRLLDGDVRNRLAVFDVLG